MFNRIRLATWSALFDLIYIAIPTLVVVLHLFLSEKPLFLFLGMPDLMALSVVLSGEAIRDSVSTFGDASHQEKENRKSGLIFGMLGLVVSSALIFYSYQKGYGSGVEASAEYSSISAGMFIAMFVGSFSIKWLKRYREMETGA
jgi:hypothetical protein